MQVISATEERTITTPAGKVVSLAAPSQGSKEVCTWRVEMPSGVSSPVHVIDRDQVWMPIEGTFSFTIDDVVQEATVGQAIVVPGDSVRSFQVPSGSAQALVAMVVGGQAGMPGSDARQPLPWAQ